MAFDVISCGPGFGRPAATRTALRDAPTIIKNMTEKSADVEHFISRWQATTASELATAQSFVMDLCELLNVDKPHATVDQDYMFERPLKEAHGDGSQSDRRVDC